MPNYIHQPSEDDYFGSNKEVTTKSYRYTTTINSATKIIFICNLHHNITNSVLRTHFVRFGNIVNIEINVTGVFGFVEYKHKNSAISAINELNGKMLKGHRLQLDYGTIKEARCLLINGISKSISEQCLVECVNCSLSNAQLGRVRSCLMDEMKGSALLFFECDIIIAYNTLCEFFCINDVHLEVDFASDSFMFKFGDSPDIISFKANTELDQDRILNYSTNEQRFARNFHNMPSNSTFVLNMPKLNSDQDKNNISVNNNSKRRRCLIRTVPITKLIIGSNAATSDAPISSRHSHSSNFFEPLDLRVHEPNPSTDYDTISYPIPTLSVCPERRSNTDQRLGECEELTNHHQCFETNPCSISHMSSSKQNTTNCIIPNADQRLGEYEELTNHHQYFETNVCPTAHNMSSSTQDTTNYILQNADQRIGECEELTNQHQYFETKLCLAAHNMSSSTQDTTNYIIQNADQRLGECEELTNHHQYVETNLCPTVDNMSSSTQDITNYITQNTDQRLGECEELTNHHQCVETNLCPTVDNMSSSTQDITNYISQNTDQRLGECEELTNHHQYVETNLCSTVDNMSSSTQDITNYITENADQRLGECEELTNHHQYFETKPCLTEHISISTQETKNDIIPNATQRISECEELEENQQHFQTNLSPTAHYSSSTMSTIKVIKIKTEPDDTSVDFDSGETFVKYESMYDKVKGRSRKKTKHLEKMIKIKVEGEDKTKCCYLLRKRK